MPAELEHVSVDPLPPPRPGPAFYDTQGQTWVLSQYEDIRVALREPRLLLRGRHDAKADVGDPRMRTRAEIRKALSAAKLAEWRARKVSREATASVSVAGIQMSKGERANLLLASANRDPKKVRGARPPRHNKRRGRTGGVRRWIALLCGSFAHPHGGLGCNCYVCTGGCRPRRDRNR